METEGTSTTPTLTVEPVEPLPIGIFEVPASTPETVVTSTDPVILPESVVIEPLPSMDDSATTTDQSALSLENPTPDAAPAASDVATYYIDKYYEKIWNGSSKNHYFLGTISLATDNLSGSTAGLFYTLGDHLGSSSLITNSYGNMTERTEYYPFGQVAATAVSQDSGNRYTFTGKELDPETNLQYFGARYYGQNLGRFMAIDPYGLQMSKLMKVLSDPQSLNGYAYTRNNPVVLIDPDGNESVWNSMLQKMNGAGNAILSNNAFGYGRVQSNDPSYNTGQKVGDAMSLMQGAFETAFGIITAIGGGTGAVVLSPTGAGALIGTAVSASGIAIAGHGYGVAILGVHNIMNDDNSQSSNFVPGKSGDPAKNIESHWTKHRSEFPELKTADQYARKAETFLTKPPEGSLVRSLKDNRTAIYDPSTNTLGVSENGVPASLFRPNPSIHGFKTNLDYFNSLK